MLAHVPADITAGGAGHSPQQRCAKVCLDSGTLTPLLKKLEEKGYIVRSRDKGDERVLMVSITESGMDLREKALYVPGSIVTCIPLSYEDAAVLTRILRGMMAEFSRDQQ